MSFLVSTVVAVGSNKHNANKNPLKAIKYKFKKLMSKKTKINDVTSSLSCSKRAQNTHSSDDTNTPITISLKYCNVTSNENCSDIDAPCICSGDIKDTKDRTYKLLSTKEMISTSIPSYYFTNNEHDILSKGWDIIHKIGEEELYKQYKNILLEQTDLSTIFMNNGVYIDVIQHQFEIFYGMFSKIITQNEYRQYDTDIIMITAVVLRMIGIRNVIKYKIIPSDYQLFQSSLFILFHKYLYRYYQQYPQYKSLLYRCWEYIFNSITLAFDVKDCAYSGMQ